MKRLSLTFDNGPTPGITDLVLDTLGRFDVKATFFLVGQQLEAPGGRALAERTAHEGHRIGNHSFSHGAPLGLRTDAGGASAEILAMHRLLGPLAGAEVLYRPNGRGTMGPHLLNREAVDTLADLKASVVLWTSVPRDRKVVVESPSLWVADALRAVEDAEWPVIVLHDRPSGFAAPGPMAFLGDFLRQVSGRVEFRLDFPADCVPLDRGRPTAALTRYATAA